MCCHDIPAEAVNFFVRFSRFEYALKRIDGFAEQDDSGFIKIRWKSFLHGKPNITAPGNESVDYYFDNPPGKFVLGDNVNPWHRIQGVRRNNHDLLRLLRQVRNNLFHGEKPELVFGGSDADVERSLKLLRHGLNILNKFIELEPRIFEYIGH